ncbi:MAG: MlaD family protein [Candidatus Aminicenantes bacterium]|jgi:ABC-type transporter Mla subunit MlaD
MGLFGAEKKEKDEVVEDRTVREFKQKVKVGAFFTVVLLIFALFILFVGDVGLFLKKKGYPLYVTFDTVIGLAKRSYVRMAGMKVGYVKDIRLKGNRPEVEIMMNPSVEIPIGSKATLATAGLIGERYVEIVPGEEEIVFQPGDSIPPATSVGIEQLGNMLLSVGEEVRNIGESIKTILGEEEKGANVKDILKDFSVFASDLREFLSENKQEIGKGIERSSQAVTKFDKKVEVIAADLEEFVATLKDLVDENRESVKLNLDRIKELIEKTEESLNLLNESLEKINRGEGTLGKLIKEPDLYQRADETIGDLEKIISPLASLKARIGLRTEYFSQSKVLKHVFSLDLWPAGNTYFLGQAVYDPWQDRFTVSAQGGLRWGPFVPRIGILESKVGAGLDIYTLGDRLRVSLEGVDFNRKTSPRFRAWTRYAATKHLYFILGVEDFTLAAHREFYLGLELGL